MNQTEFRASGAGASQKEKILAALQDDRGNWVPMPDLAAMSGAYAVHSRINDLRKAGHTIEHMNVHADGKVQSFYRLVIAEVTP